MANRNFARAMRRKTQWFGMGPATGVALPTYTTLGVGVPAIISQALIAGGAAGLLDEEGTITRMIGQISAQLDAETADVQATVAVGMGVFRDEAVAAGVASLPSPEDDPDFEWLFYGVYGLGNGPTTAGQNDQLSSLRVDFDVRGQRIVRTGQNVVWLAEAQTAALRVMVGGRYLIKLT